MSLDLPQQKASSRPVYDMDAGRAYFNVQRFGDDASDLFAINLSTTTAGSADLDGDGLVNFNDLLMLLTAWGPCLDLDCPRDLDASGAVGFADVLIVLSHWS